MRKLSFAIVVAAARAMCASAAPLGVDLGLEAGADSLLGEGDVELYIQPQAEYALGDTGWRLGLSWEIPLVPDVEVGTLEGFEEIELVLRWMVLTVGNNNELALDAQELEGYVYAAAERSLGPLALGIELDARYLPDFLTYSAPKSPDDDKVWVLLAIAEAAWETDLGPGALAVAIEQNVPLYGKWELGDTELTVSYEGAVGGVGVTIEVESVLSADATFAVSARLILLKPL